MTMTLITVIDIWALEMSNAIYKFYQEINLNNVVL